MLEKLEATAKWMERFTRSFTANVLACLHSWYSYVKQNPKHSANVVLIIFIFWLGVDNLLSTVSSISGFTLTVWSITLITASIMLAKKNGYFGWIKKKTLHLFKKT